MVFDSIENIFESIREHDVYSRALVTLASIIGTFILLFLTIKTLYKTIQYFKRKYGQWAVISGSTDGIGLAMAKELARRGMSIVVIGRNDEKLSNTKALLESETNVGDILTVKIDLSDASPENFEKARKKIDPDNRDIGILINNAGIYPNTYQHLHKFDMEADRTIVNVNILAPIYLAKMVIPGMLKRERGMIVNVSSVFGSIAGPYGHHYASSKTFIDRFTQQLQMEYSSSPIDIIDLTPGAVHTKLFTGNANFDHISPFVPRPEHFAKSVINALSTGIGQFSGTWAHGLVHEMSVIFYKLGLVPFFTVINIKKHAKSHNLSLDSKTDKRQSRGDGDQVEAVTT